MAETAVTRPSVVGGENAGPEIHLLDVLALLGRHKRIVFGMPIVTGGIALLVSLLMTPIFTSTVKIMPPQQSQGAGVAAMLGQLGGLAGAAGGLAGIKNSADVYVGLLESRSAMDSLIARFKLKERYEKATMDDTRAELKKNSQIRTGAADGMISVSASDKDPKFAADLANAYVEELIKLTQTFAITEASQRRVFFEKQMEGARDQLTDAEIALRRTQEKTGMIQPDKQVQAIITSLAQLKGTIAAKEVELNSIRTFATSQNPELIRTAEELRSLRGQLAKAETKQSGASGDFMVPTGKIPEVGVEYVRSIRNVKYYESMFEVLAKQFELAKIDEAKNSSLVQVLDKAIPAERKSKPSRALITLTGFFCGFIFAVIFALMREAYLGSRRNLENAARWDRLAAAWWRAPAR